MILNGKCEHCGGGIEFEAEQAGQYAECPHCGASIKLAGGTEPFPKPPDAYTAEKRRAWRTWLRLLAVSFIGIALVLAIVVVQQLGKVEMFASLLGDAIGVVVAVAVLGFIIVWCVLWLLFPDFVYFDLHKIRRLLEQVRDK